MDINQPSTQRRRSERVSLNLCPWLFAELIFWASHSRKRLRRCRLISTVAGILPGITLPKNTWVTLEVPQSSGGRHVRARVAWIQRPHSTRDYFQVAVELESPANIWEMDLWTVEGTAWTSLFERHWLVRKSGSSNEVNESVNSWKSELNEVSFIPGEPIEKVMADTANAHASKLSIEPTFEYSSSAAESPLLRELSAELRRQAKEAVESEASETAERTSGKRRRT